MGLLDRLLGPGDREAFAEEVRRRLARHHRGGKVEYDPAAFALTVEGGGVMNLANVWAEVADASRGARRSAARRFVDALAAPGHPEIPATWEEAAPLLLPKLRGRVWLEHLALEARIRGQAPLEIPRRVIGEHYTVELVCDFPQSCATVSADDLAKWGRTFDDALVTATRNLRQRPPEAITSLGPEGAPLLYIVMSGDTYDATRLLTLDVVQRRIGKTLDAVAIPLHRGALLLGDAALPESLRALADTAAQNFDEPYPNAAVPLHFEFGEWVPWLPAPGHPAHEALASLTRRSVQRDCTEQTEALNKLHEAQGPDAFVASLFMPDDWSTQQPSVAWWGDGIRTWIPRADVVAMGPRGADGEPDRSLAIYVPWNRLVELAGASMRELPVFPRRWEVREFPDAATMERLAAVAVPKP